MDNFQEDNIRPPDKNIRETLLEDTRSDFEKHLDEAMYLSMQEINQQIDINNQYEELLLRGYALEFKKRNEIFKIFLFNLNKVGRFDKKVREIYDILEPIIDSYCGQYIETCELDGETYDKIFNILKEVRNVQQAFEILKLIILRE